MQYLANRKLSLRLIIILECSQQGRKREKRRLLHLIFDSHFWKVINHTFPTPKNN